MLNFALVILLLILNGLLHQIDFVQFLQQIQFTLKFLRCLLLLLDQILLLFLELDVEITHLTAISLPFSRRVVAVLFDFFDSSPLLILLNNGVLLSEHSFFEQKTSFVDNF